MRRKKLKAGDRVNVDGVCMPIDGSPDWHDGDTRTVVEAFDDRIVTDSKGAMRGRCEVHRIQCVPFKEKPKTKAAEAKTKPNRI